MEIYKIIIAVILMLSVYGALNYYLFRKVVILLSQPPQYAALLVSAFAITFLVAQILAHFSDSIYVIPLYWISSLWLGFVVLFFGIQLCADVLWWLVVRYLSAIVSLRLYTSLVFLVTVVMTAVGVQSAQQVNVSEINLKSPRISMPVTLVQISDLHIGLLTNRAQVQQLVLRINQLQPDLIVSTGDLIDMQQDHIDIYAAILSQLRAVKGKFAVFGNHEAFAGQKRALDFTQQAGFQVLRNTVVRIGEINLVGVDDPEFVEFTGEKPADEKQLLQSVNTGYTVLLKHQPRISNANAFDLQLSGHTHGGQIFPFGLLTEVFYRQAPGLSRVGTHSWLYLNRGAGTWGPPMRVASGPEITLIRIMPEH